MHTVVLHQHGRDVHVWSEYRLIAKSCVAPLTNEHTAACTTGCTRVRLRVYLSSVITPDTRRRPLSAAAASMHAAPHYCSYLLYITSRLGSGPCTSVHLISCSKCPKARKVGMGWEEICSSGWVPCTPAVRRLSLTFRTSPRSKSCCGQATVASGRLPGRRTHLTAIRSFLLLFVGCCGLF